jgi:hypothetical protein
LHAGVKATLVVVRLAGQVTAFARHVWIALAADEERCRNEQSEVPHDGSTAEQAKGSR